MSKNEKKKSGFTLIELLLVISIIAILSGVMFTSIKSKDTIDKSRFTSAQASLKELANVAQIEAARNGYYAPDVPRGIPSEFIQYLSPAAMQAGPYPGSEFDWDNWEGDTCWDGSTGIIQVSLRQINDYNGQTDYNLYWVIHGEGIPHCTDSAARGECLNCESRYP